MVDFLKRTGKPDLAYVASPPRDGALPSVIFCGGYRSDMRGTKASFLEERCRARGQGFVRFDYSGHGESGGDIDQGTMSQWCEDARDIFDELISGPAIVIGSSMGGWVGLKLALARPERARAFIGIAAAPDFTRWMEAGFTPEQRAQLETLGYAEEPSEYGDPYRFTRAFLDDGAANAIMADGRIPFTGPVRLLHGMQDQTVEWQVAHRIKNALDSTDCDVYLVEDGDHSLSRPHDLALLDKSLVDLTGRI